VLEELLEPAVIKAGEEVAEVRVEHPVHLLLRDTDRQRIQRVVRAAPWPEPVGEAEKVLLVDGVEHLDDGPLDDLVLQRGDTERPLPPVSLRDVHPPRRHCPVGAVVDPLVQVPEVGLQVLAVGPPCQPVHPRCGPLAQRLIGRPQAFQINMVQQRREPCVLVPACYFAHTVQPA